MPVISVTARNGRERLIDVPDGLSLMEAIRDHGGGEIEAICGGCCSCATCHVFVDPEHLGRLSPISENERDLLDGSDHRRPNSRLACQIPLVKELDGLRVTVAPED